MTSNAETNGLSIDELAGDRIKRELVKAVKKQLNSDNVEVCIEHGSKKGDNFIGEVFRILYKDVADTSNDRQSSLIMKIAPKNPIRREHFQTRKLFLREINMYDKVLSFFHEFQLSKEIPEENGFHEHAKCYFSIDEELSESLFLEDLRRRNFELLNHREEPITFDHMALLMKAFGKFHALSFVLRDQQPAKLAELSSLLKEQHWTMLESEFCKLYPSMVKRLTDILEEENRFDLVERFNKVAGDDYTKTIYRLVSSTEADPYAVICHGDLTILNCMFSKNEQGKPTDIQFFDWQFSRFASPVTELVLTLFCSTTKELRDKHFDDFLKIYHQSLSELVTRLGSDPQKLFPFEALLEQFRQFGVYTIFVGAILIPMLCADVDSMPDFEALPEKFDDDMDDDNVFRISDKPAYNKKVTDIFIDLARIGAI